MRPFCRTELINLLLEFPWQRLVSQGIRRQCWACAHTWWSQYRACAVALVYSRHKICRLHSLKRKEHCRCYFCRCISLYGPRKTSQVKKETIFFCNSAIWEQFWGRETILTNVFSSFLFFSQCFWIISTIFCTHIAPVQLNWSYISNCEDRT